MSNWKECDVLEKDIILSIKRKPSTITEIAKNTKRAKSTVSESVKRLNKQGIVTKTHDYQKDARNTKITLNLDKIKIEKTNTFYLIYFVLSFVPFASALIFSIIFKKYFLVLGTSIELLPPLLFILYHIYIKEDKVIVYKNPKGIKKKKDSQELDNPLGITN